jgi:hypothetical protein
VQYSTDQCTVTWGTCWHPKVYFHLTQEETKIRHKDFSCGYQDSNCLQTIKNDYPINSTKACWLDPKHDSVTFSPPGDNKLKGAWVGAGFGIAFLCIAFIACMAYFCLGNQLCRKATEEDIKSMGLPRERSDDATKPKTLTMEGEDTVDVRASANSFIPQSQYTQSPYAAQFYYPSAPSYGQNPMMDRP